MCQLFPPWGKPRSLAPASSAMSWYQQEDSLWTTNLHEPHWTAIVQVRGTRVSRHLTKRQVLVSPPVRRKRLACLIWTAVV
jgi:hypothetical protein